ncbi:MAG: class I SAM-dependent methyltransferase [Acidobacteriota bacterium]
MRAQSIIRRMQIRADKEASRAASRARNREVWNRWAGVNYASEFYDVDGFVTGWRQGANPRRQHFDALEADLLGDVAGQTLLHLQCHFGMDTLTQARRGARVTGVDYSSEAVDRARELAQRLAVTEARFLCSDLYELPGVLDETFDVVFTSIGVLSWLDDLEGWARVVHDHLSPGGRFVLLESHPLVWIFDDEVEERRLDVRYDYFERSEPLQLEQEGVYSDPSAVEPSVTFEWAHSLSEIVRALLGAGLILDSLEEYAEIAWPLFPWMEKTDGGSWRLPDGFPTLPLMFSIAAHRPGAATP